MLKPTDPPASGPDSLSGLFGRARDNARDWAKAEVALYRTIATEKALAWRTPLILLAVALFLGHAVFLVLIATLFVGLAQLMNPALAGLLSAAILAIAAAILVKVALAKLKDPAA